MANPRTDGNSEATPEGWDPPLRSHRMVDRDPRVSIATCDAWLADGREPAVAVCRLVEMLGTGDVALDGEIEDCLVRHFEAARPTIAKALSVLTSMLDAPGPAAQRKAASLFRVWQRGGDRTTDRTAPGRRNG